LGFVLLYIHLLFATVWIGGLMTLVGFIIYLKGEKSIFFYKFTTYYGWLNIFVLTFLVLSGAGLLHVKGLFDIFLYMNEFTILLWIKIALVFFVILATIIHSFIVLKSSRRTKLQNILSKISSFYILISCFFILYLAMKIRDLL
jgi:putative copper export protein